MNFRCPVCKKILPQPAEEGKEYLRYFPFCSARCKLLDLGAWFDGDYKVISQATRYEPSDEPYSDTEV